MRVACRLRAEKLKLNRRLFRADGPERRLRCVVFVFVFMF
jgi:hypothetical protein